MTTPDIRGRVRKLIDDGDPLAAENEVRSLLTAGETGNVELWALLALALAQQRRVGLAEEACRFGLTLSANDPDLNYLLTQILTMREQVRSTAYWQTFQIGRHTNRDYPRMVAIETVGRCNATCSFCPNGSIERRNMDMDEALFSKIVSDLEQIPKTHVFTICPNIVNEPFMDRRIFDRCRMINERLPNARLAFFTNLSFFPPGFLDNLKSLKHIVRFNVSLNAAEPRAYQEAMGLDLAKTAANLNALMKFRRERKLFSEPVILSRLTDGSSGHAAFRSQCLALFPGFVEKVDYICQSKAKTDWLGRIDLPTATVPFGQPCGAWLDFAIFCSGVVPHCCLDAHGEYPWGDVRKSSVLEIYNSPQFRRLRENLTSREGVHPCSSCALLQ